MYEHESFDAVMSRRSEPTKRKAQHFPGWRNVCDDEHDQTDVRQAAAEVNEPLHTFTCPSCLCMSASNDNILVIPRELLKQDRRSTRKVYKLSRATRTATNHIFSAHELRHLAVQHAALTAAKLRFYVSQNRKYVDSSRKLSLLDLRQYSAYGSCPTQSMERSST